MGKTSRYDTSSLIEDQHELGSYGRILKNLLGIKTTREAYFAAVRAGLERDYEPMKRVFNEAILRILRVDKAGQHQSPPGKPIQDQSRSHESPQLPKRK